MEVEDVKYTVIFKKGLEEGVVKYTFDILEACIDQCMIVYDVSSRLAKKMLSNKDIDDIEDEISEVGVYTIGYDNRMCSIKMIKEDPENFNMVQVV